MNDFNESVIGQISARLNVTLRDLKRSMRERFGQKPSASYTTEQAAAAQAAMTALADVDRVFATCRLKDPLSYCDCCTDPHLVTRLVSTQRDDLSEDDVAVVAGSLLYTIGDADDFKYFVPRFCRDTLVNPLYDIDSIFARFERAGFNVWPDPEQQAVRRFLGTAWRSVLLTNPRRDLSELTDPWLAILDGMASVGFIADALAIWDAEHGDAADARLLALLDALMVDEGSIGLSGAGGFCDNSAAYDILEQWLSSADVRTRIDASLHATRDVDAELADRIDRVLGALVARAKRH